MITTSSIAELRKVLGAERAGGRTVGFVPTLGALHDGHRSLVARARAETDVVVVSIFVNPTQFDRSADLDTYPRTLDADLELCHAEGTDIVFHPTVEEIYPQPVTTSVAVHGLTDGMEGAHRPGHFDGVTLVCCKLFSIVGPCRAYFGQKDVQQLRVVARMAADLDLPVELAACPTVRDADGLALSSRNVHLSSDERRRALAIPTALRGLADLVGQGTTAADDLLTAGRIILAPVDELDYLEIVDPHTLEPIEMVEGEALVCVAARVGGTRLIDNITLEG